MSGGLSLVRGAAIASVLACVPPEVPPPVAPGLLWVRDLETSDAGPLMWWGADGVPTGAVYGFRDSLVALDAATGTVLQAWAWPPGFRDRSWEQERFSSSPYGVALFGAQSVAILRPDGSVENRPYPIGGASFCSGSLSATGELLLSWRRDSSATGPEANQVLWGDAHGWTAVATAPDAQGLFDAPQSWKRGWFAVLRRGPDCQLWWTDRGRLRTLPLVGGDGTGHPAAVSGAQLFFASQDSAVAVDLGRGTRTWARSLPSGLDVGVHRLAADRSTWVIFSSRGWWIELRHSDGSLASQGAVPPTWLERWTGEPWIFTRGNSLYYWNYDKPAEVVLAPESLSAQAVAVRGYAMVRMGSNAAAVALP